jgi:hypothetical protein
VRLDTRQFENRATTAGGLPTEDGAGRVGSIHDAGQSLLGVDAICRRRPLPRYERTNGDELARRECQAETDDYVLVQTPEIFPWQVAAAAVVAVGHRHGRPRLSSFVSQLVKVKKEQTTQRLPRAMAEHSTGVSVKLPRRGEEVAG